MSGESVTERYARVVPRWSQLRGPLSYVPGCASHVLAFLHEKVAGVVIWNIQRREAGAISPRIGSFSRRGDGCCMGFEQGPVFALHTAAVVCSIDAWAVST